MNSSVVYLLQQSHYACHDPFCATGWRLSIYQSHKNTCKKKAIKEEPLSSRVFKKRVIGKRCYMCGNRASPGQMHGLDKVNPSLPMQSFCALQALCHGAEIKAALVKIVVLSCCLASPKSLSLALPALLTSTCQQMANTHTRA